MRGKAVSALMLTLQLVFILMLAFYVQSVMSDYSWTETIYIRADGSVESDTALILSADNITYMLTDNIVEADPTYYESAMCARDPLERVIRQLGENRRNDDE